MSATITNHYGRACTKRLRERPATYRVHGLRESDAVWALPDGLFFALNCPSPDLPSASLRRTPVVLAVSEDGHTFGSHYIIGDEPDRPLRFPGAYKHGRYGYPCAHFLNDKLFIINSVGKEDIECHIFDVHVID